MSRSSSSMPATSFPSHQLRSGLYVSGHPDQYKEKVVPMMSSAAAPYTGGDVKKSGELGKMFDIKVEAPMTKISGPSTATFRTGTLSGPLSSSGAPRSALSASGPINVAGSMQEKNRSGPLLSNYGPLSGSRSTNSPEFGPSITTSEAHARNSSKHSGPLAANLPVTGLITSGPISSGPLSAASSRRFSGSLDSTDSKRLLTGPAANNQAINHLGHDKLYSFRKNFSKVILWTLIPLFVIGFIAGAFILAAVKNAILLMVVAALFVAVVLLVLWNAFWWKRTLITFTNRYSDAELSTAKDGQYVKVTGVVTCGSVALETSFQKVNRCIYTSTGLYEYRGIKSLPANDKHRHFTWGLRHLERHAVDFYISDFQSGLRALVKTGYGATVSPYVEESVVLKLTENAKDLPENFLRWLADRNLSRDERTMRLSEGFIKEGSTVTVLGVVQRRDNLMMIISPPRPVSTGCQWTKFLLPASVEGIILISENSSVKVDIA